MKEKSKVKSSKLLKLFTVHSSLSTVYLLFTIYYLLLAANAFGAEKLELTLKEAIDIALKENLFLMEERQDLNISEADIKVKEGEFDPTFKLSLSESFKKSELPSIYIPGVQVSWGVMGSGLQLCK